MTTPKLPTGVRHQTSPASLQGSYQNETQETDKQTDKHRGAMLLFSGTVADTSGELRSLH